MQTVSIWRFGKQVYVTCRSALVVLMLISIIGGCAPLAAPADGMVLPLQSGSTAWGMRQALQFQPGTIIMVKDNLTLLGWTLEGLPCFAVVRSNVEALRDWQAATGGQGNLVNWRTMTDLRVFLQEQGWKPVTVTTAEAAAQVGQIGAWLANVSSALTTFVIIPAGMANPFGNEYDGVMQ